MLKAISLLLSLTYAVLGSAQLPRIEYSLDIVGYPLTPDDSVSLEMRPGALPPKRGGISDKPNLKVTLLSLDRLSYRPGDSAVYEVLLENVGSNIVRLPWSPDIAAFKPILNRAPNTVRRGSLFLEIQSAQDSKRLAWLEPQPLLGNEGINGSVVSLRPGEKALVRTPAHWRSSDRDRARLLAQANGLVRVAAMLALDEYPITISSGNSIDIIFQAP
jgi:hypothetical protein